MYSNLAEEFAHYPTLSDMGIIHFHEISHYSVRQDGPGKDVLRVIYKRAKGSLLPYSRKYKFGRSLKTVVTDGGTARMQRSYEVSPTLLKATSELDDLVSCNRHVPVEPYSQLQKSSLMAEINELKQLINGTIRSDAMGQVNSKLDSVRRHIDAL